MRSRLCGTLNSLSLSLTPYNARCSRTRLPPKCACEYLCARDAHKDFTLSQFNCKCLWFVSFSRSRCALFCSFVLVVFSSSSSQLFSWQVPSSVYVRMILVCGLCDGLLWESFLRKQSTWLEFAFLHHHNRISHRQISHSLHLHEKFHTLKLESATRSIIGILRPFRLNNWSRTEMKNWMRNLE